MLLERLRNAVEPPGSASVPHLRELAGVVLPVQPLDLRPDWAVQRCERRTKEMMMTLSNLPACHLFGCVLSPCIARGSVSLRNTVR